ncbi:MAG: glycoside hydrolase family 5 protein [Vibrio sp.]
MREIRFVKFWLLVFFMVFLNIGCRSEDNEGPKLSDQYYTDLYYWNSSKGLDFSFLGRGINLGNYLESPNYEGEWNNDFIIQSSDFENIESAGFASVRIPVRWNAHTQSDPKVIDEVFMARVQQVVDYAIQNQLKVIINSHHFDELFYNKNEFDQHRQRLLSFWNQIAQRFPLSEYDEEQLVFEFLNEPHGNLGVKEWNALVADLTKLIWLDNASSQHNSLGQRKIMIGTADWGGPTKLNDLVLPDSVSAQNTIITVHFYEPFQFTHQGADWVENAKNWIGTRWLGTVDEQKVLTDYLNVITDWNQQAGRGFEINIGEFGVYSKYSQPQDQKAWTAYIAREAEKRRFSWHYWEYSSDFGAYDFNSNQWRSELIDALIPQ